MLRLKKQSLKATGYDYLPTRSGGQTLFGKGKLTPCCQPGLEPSTLCARRGQVRLAQAAPESVLKTVSIVNQMA